jgi:hypothetical protein
VHPSPCPEDNTIQFLSSIKSKPKTERCQGRKKGIRLSLRVSLCSDLVKGVK